jgi:SpoU rRNA methylase family enzyme
MDERLSKAEIRKDAMQNVVEAAAGTVGQVATILTAAVKDVAGTVGGFATELFEIRDAANRASQDSATDDDGPTKLDD